MSEPRPVPAIAARLMSMSITWLLTSEIEYTVERRDALTDGRREECTRMVDAIKSELARRQEVRA